MPTSPKPFVLLILVVWVALQGGMCTLMDLPIDLSIYLFVLEEM